MLNVAGQGNNVAGRDIHHHYHTVVNPPAPQPPLPTDFQSFNRTQPHELSRSISARGFLILTDLVGSTKQTHDKTELILQGYHDHRIRCLKAIAEPLQLQWLTHAGDADLLFLPGEDIGPLLQFFRALNDPARVPAYEGMQPVFRMVAHQHRFTFLVSDIKSRLQHEPGNHVTLLFRLEKECPARQLLLTKDAFDLLPSPLPSDLTRSEGSFPLGLMEWTKHAANHLYWLQLPATSGQLLADLPKCFPVRLGEVARRVGHIRIFGGLYDDVDMGKNFLNLLLDDHTSEADSSFAQPRNLNLGDRLAMRPERQPRHDHEQEEREAPRAFGWQAHSTGLAWRMSRRAWRGWRW